MSRRRLGNAALGKAFWSWPSGVASPQGSRSKPGNWKNRFNPNRPHSRYQKQYRQAKCRQNATITSSLAAVEGNACGSHLRRNLRSLGFSGLAGARRPARRDGRFHPPDGVVRLVGLFGLGLRHWGDCGVDGRAVGGRNPGGQVVCRANHGESRRRRRAVLTRSTTPGRFPAPRDLPIHPVRATFCPRTPRQEDIERILRTGARKHHHGGIHGNHCRS